MSDTGPVVGRYGLAKHDIRGYRSAVWNETAPGLVEETIRRGDGALSEGGALVALTGQHTGRSPNDKFIVEEAATAESIWWGKVNVAMSEDHFERLHAKVIGYFRDRDLFVQDLFAGADPEYRLKVRVVSESAWHSLFARNMFIHPGHDQLADFIPDFTVLHAPGLEAEPSLDGTSSGTFIVVSFARRLVLIGGSSYAGEIKKSIFSILNYLLPERDVLPMHCSANLGPAGDAAIFFGLSGTGKTTLSADGTRSLIGDDEHGWSAKGVFNFEGGCYAKVTADAFGVLPPISRLTPEQAMYHFLSGYTARVAGTEKGMGSEPSATFSTCFGAPFMPRHPSVYAEMLGRKMADTGAKCWLVNTGWTGGGYGIGRRMEIAHTRAMVRAALDGRLAEVATSRHPDFGLHIPAVCPDVPEGVLDPKSTWRDKRAYDQTARELTRRFETNFKQFESYVDAEVKAAGIYSAA